MRRGAAVAPLALAAGRLRGRTARAGAARHAKRGLRQLPHGGLGGALRGAGRGARRAPAILRRPGLPRHVPESGPRACGGHRLRSGPSDARLGTRRHGRLHARAHPRHADGIALDRARGRRIARSATPAARGGTPVTRRLERVSERACAPGRSAAMSHAGALRARGAGAGPALALDADLRRRVRVLAFAVAGAGYVLSGGHGVQDFARTAVSLVQLVLLLVPLTALVIGVLSLAPERGAAELLFSQPVTRGTILFGKLLGLFQALGAAQAVGFGAAGMARLRAVGSGRRWAASSLLVAGLPRHDRGLPRPGRAAVGRHRWAASGRGRWPWHSSSGSWPSCSSTSLALGVASLLPSGTASRVLMVSAIVNPARRGAHGRPPRDRGHRRLRRGARSRSSASPAGREPPGVVLALSLIFWLTVPAGLALRRLRRADL